MDGNGRWAQARGYGRPRGHREGAKRVDEIVTECCRLGVRYLTLYTFSTENWRRPITEISVLMRLLFQNLRTMDKKLLKNRVRLVTQGDLEKLPHFVRMELQRVMRLTSFENPAMFLNLALSYGGRQEIVDAARAIAEKTLNGECRPADIDEEFFRSHLHHPDFPDPDLLIRTGGEARVSNFLLWEIAYTEIFVTNERWPEFNKDSLHNALGMYGKRQRRFGKTSEQVIAQSESQPHFTPPQ